MTYPAFERRARHDATTDDLKGGDQPLTDEAPAEEGYEAAQESADLEQDPERVPNRIQRAEPPRTETVGAADGPTTGDDEIYDEAGRAD